MAQQTVGSNFRASSLYVGDLSPEVTEVGTLTLPALLAPRKPSTTSSKVLVTSSLFVFAEIEYASSIPPLISPPTLPLYPPAP